MAQFAGEIERGNHSRLQHHKKQGCFGIKILAFKCQIELPEMKMGPIWCSRNRQKEVMDDVFLKRLSELYFCLSCNLKVVFWNI